MQEHDVYQRLKDSLPTIFAYALKRTNNRHEAEDLSQEIILQLWSSASGLRDIEKFHGWMWAVAENVFKGYLRKKTKHSSAELPEHKMASPALNLPENLVADKEEIGLLYRELSLLSGLYRETTVLYYIHCESTETIAQTLNISQDMVKQYLFKSRKKVKQGMSQIRERGQGSFNPRKFNIYFWGQGRNMPELFSRKLPGNIMLETYYSPITVEQLGIELGVASVYLEDEIQILLKNDLLKQTHNNRYQSNIIIFTAEFEAELETKTKHVYSGMAHYLYEFLLENEDQLRGIGFHGHDINRNALIWQLSSLLLFDAINRVPMEILQELPTSGSSQGYYWGLERSYGDNNFDLGLHRYSDGKGNHIHLIDYYITGQHYKICEKPKASLLLKVARNLVLSEDDEELLPQLIQDGYVRSANGSLSLPFPVYTASELRRIKSILRPASEHLYKACKALLPMTEEVLNNFVPAYLRHQVPVLACLKQVEACIMNTMNTMYLNKFIEVPKPCNELLSTYAELTD